MRTTSQSRRLRRRCAAIIALPVVVALLAPAAAHGAAQADARVGLDTAGGAPVAGQVFLLTVLVESLPLSAGASFSFVTTLDLPAGVTFVAVGRSEPLPTQCEASGQTLTCRSRHLGGDISSNANLQFRAARPGSYVFNASVAIEGEADTTPANNTTTRTVTVAAAPALPKPCIVPNVVRKPLASARSAILKAGCRVGVTRTASSASVPKGRVMRQTPGARKRVARGTRVTLVVSRGKQS